jgi:uncharacterized circularly permuted ATP-grasp superfamily protein
MSTSSSALFTGYTPIPGAFDEFFIGPDESRPELRQIVSALDKLGPAELAKRQQLANSVFLNAGVTFSVYSDNKGTERIFPFDLLPRVILPDQWAPLERGLSQRVRALNLFLKDIYSEQKVLKDKIVPAELVLGSTGFLKKMMGIHPPHDNYIHISGIDLIRAPSGEFLVLEDNARTPSGVSYVLENRGVLKRALPVVFSNLPVLSVDDYPQKLRNALDESAPVHTKGEPRVVVLTPGPFNSAYFEHSFLARRMGCDLVHNSDLFVDDKKVYLKTTSGPQQVDVIYRRIDDDFLDPEFFRKDSLLGVPGLVSAYAAGNVSLANAIGNGVADDKAVYRYVPAMIKYYLGEEAILGQVQTYDCSEPEDLKYVLGHLNELVVKAVDGSGGYGMLMGPTASEEERREFGLKLKANPRGYIAQPRIELSTAPTWCDSRLGPRRLDLRPFIVTGKDTWVLPGGLTRVALKEGSYVVNSSQGGGSKDTWVLGMAGNTKQEGGTL